MMRYRIFLEVFVYVRVKMFPGSYGVFFVVSMLRIIIFIDYLCVCLRKSELNKVEIKHVSLWEKGNRLLY